MVLRRWLISDRNSAIGVLHCFTLCNAPPYRRCDIYCVAIYMWYRKSFISHLYITYMFCYRITTFVMRLALGPFDYR